MLFFAYFHVLSHDMIVQTIIIRSWGGGARFFYAMKPNSTSSTGGAEANSPSTAPPASSTPAAKDVSSDAYHYSSAPASLPLVSGVFKDPSHPIGYCFNICQEFVQDSVRLVRRCNKPDPQEFNNMVRACSFGMLMMGFIGFIVKLVFIPINNIIVGSG